jgi:hypothetical protein
MFGQSGSTPKYISALDTNDIVLHTSEYAIVSGSFTISSPTTIVTLLYPYMVTTPYVALTTFDGSHSIEVTDGITTWTESSFTIDKTNGTLTGFPQNGTFTYTYYAYQWRRDLVLANYIVGSGGTVSVSTGVSKHNLHEVVANNMSGEVRAPIYDILVS